MAILAWLEAVARLKDCRLEVAWGLSDESERKEVDFIIVEKEGILGRKDRRLDDCCSGDSALFCEDDRVPLLFREPSLLGMLLLKSS